MMICRRSTRHEAVYYRNESLPSGANKRLHAAGTGGRIDKRGRERSAPTDGVSNAAAGAAPAERPQQIPLGSAEGREIPSLVILLISVVRFKPRWRLRLVRRSPQPAASSVWRIRVRSES